MMNGRFVQRVLFRIEGITVAVDRVKEERFVDIYEYYREPEYIELV